MKMAVARLAAAALLSGRMATGELPGNASMLLPSTGGAAVAAGLHPVSQASFAIKGYNCPDEGQDGQNTKMFYPSDTEGFEDGYQVVLFSHGTNGYAKFAKGYDAWLQTVASHGFVVLAPLTQGYLPDGKTKCEPALDLVQALKASSGSTPPWAAVATVKARFDSVGLMGHSAGARLLATAARNAADSGYNVAAAVLSHGGTHDPNSDALSMSAFFMDAAGDKKIAPPEKMYEVFDHVSSLHPESGHVFVNLASGEHTEPSDLGQLNDWTARFLGCHVRGNGNSCERVYGKESNALCQSVAHVKAPGTTDPTDGCSATGGVPAADLHV